MEGTGRDSVTELKLVPNDALTAGAREASTGLVTIITPTYRRDPKIVQRCIDCVRAQTFKEWNHIICSDGIRENDICDLVYKEGDPRRSYAITEKRHGDYGSKVREEVTNKWVKSKYVMFYDDDNIILPNYLERMIDALESEEAKAMDARFAVCKIMHFGPLQEFWGRPPVMLPNDKVELYYIDTLQVVAEVAAIKEIGWQHQGGYCADGVTYEALGKKFKHVKIEECLGVHI